MSFTSAPLPIRDPVVDPQRLITTPWIYALSAVQQQIDTSPSRLSGVSLQTQGASIGTTAFPTGTLGAGLYRVQPYARITRAATTSSSLTVTVSFTESTLTLSTSWPALTGNTTGTILAGEPRLIRIDASTPVSYATTYASVGGTSMQYRLDLILERINA
jgi:hypothetical protein